jgi:MerR family mercuric resistance operon transcriptional regulator
MKSMTIGKLAASAGVPTSTVRYYERIGLLIPERRAGGNYRHYTEISLERLRFIRAAQAVGLSVKDIAELIDLTHADASACGEVHQLLERRLGEIRQKMRDLRRVEKTLDQALKSCCQGRDPGICERVEALRMRKSHACP